MCTVVDLPTFILASLFAALMFTGIRNQFPLLINYDSCNNSPNMNALEKIVRGEFNPCNHGHLVEVFCVPCGNILYRPDVKYGI